MISRTDPHDLDNNEKENRLNRPIASIGNFILSRTGIDFGRGRHHHRGTVSLRDSAFGARRLRPAL